VPILCPSVAKKYKTRQKQIKEYKKTKLLGFLGLRRNRLSVNTL
jgi:hypothetical protein